MLGYSVFVKGSIMAAPSKRVELTMAEKVELLESLSSPGVTSTSIAREYGISKTQLYRLVHSKERIFALHELGLGGRKRDMRRRTCKEQVVSQALHVWYLQQMARGQRISGAILKAKATELAAAKGRDFIPSRGWLHRWKLRHNIASFKSEKQPAESDIPSSDDLEEGGLMEILSRYSPSDIFCIFESALYFRGYPENGSCRKGSVLPGGKRSNERITVMLCANINGSEKQPPLVVGTSKSPKSFPKDGVLPVSYTSAPNSWMTREIFSEWLQNWDLELRETDRLVCLLVYNSPVHDPKEIGLSNIALRVLPPNIPSVLWSMEIGVAKIWKAHYRSKLCARVTASLDVDESKNALDVALSLTLLDALYLVKEAWESVTRENIFECFMKTGFLKREPDDETGENVFTDILIPENMTLQEFDDFISVDDDLETEGELSNLDLLSVAEKSIDQMAGKDSDSCDSASEIEKNELTSKQKIRMLDHLRRFVQENAMNDMLPFVRKIEERVYLQVSGN